MMVRIAYSLGFKMNDQSQQDYLRAAKEELRLEWDVFAERVGIKPRAFKTYRMPAGSTNFRRLPDLARNAIDRLLADHRGSK